MIDPQQRRLAAAALAVAGEHGFALAGGLALAAHGVGARPSDDIELFTSNADPEAFATAVDAVHHALQSNGWPTEQHRRGPQYARLVVELTPGQHYELDLAVDYRTHPPVAVADIGPVLDVADAVGSKMTALYARGEARDYVDVRETVLSGRYTREQVLDLADQREVRPLDRSLLAGRLRQAARLQEADLAPYLATEDAAQLRRWFTAWSDDLDARSAGPERTFAPGWLTDPSRPGPDASHPDTSDLGPAL